ncbi:MAG: DnaJ domain-containing protein [Rhodospirillaceae bacterium]|nr:DnaJ domain-containing protein [Rhodospirillales bacterium]
MTSISQDPKGYYAALGLAPGADLSAIKAAYRSRAKSVHPDRNRTAGAREEFQRLVEAYRVLRDVVHRAEYDATGGHPLIEDGDDSPATPFACSCCGAVTAQPRYVVFHQVRSYLLWAKSSRVEGIFCRDCADAAAVRASTVSWLKGWWSPPGLVLTPMALIRNLFGGSKPRDQNARLLIRQARAFLALDEMDIARALTEQAARYARMSVHKRQVADLRQGTVASTRRMRERWTPWSGGVFAAQALPLLALPVVIGVFAMVATKPWDKPVATTAGIVVKPAGIGDIRHVAIADLKLRQAAMEGAPVLALLDRFTTVQVLATEGAEWSQVRTPPGVVGWVATRALYAGSASLFKQEWCAANKGSTPLGGEVLLRRANGDHRLMIHNDGRQDAVVKLKTASGNTVVSYYVPATYHLGVSGIPDGTFRIEFAIGSLYSRGCGIFAGGMQAGLMPFTLTYKQISTSRSQSINAIPEITLVTAPGDQRQPQPLDLDRFAADD